MTLRSINLNLYSEYIAHAVTDVANKLDRNCLGGGVVIIISYKE